MKTIVMNVQYEIAPIFDQCFLMASPVLRRHMVRIGILEYQKALMELVDLSKLEEQTKNVVHKIEKNRNDLVSEYELMIENIRFFHNLNTTFEGAAGSQ